MKNNNLSISLETTKIAVERPIFMNNSGFYYLSRSISQNV